MRLVARHLILFPFAVCIVFVYPLLKALDWAQGIKVVGTLEDELRELYVPK